MVGVMQVAALRGKKKRKYLKPTKIKSLLNFSVMKVFGGICWLILQSNLVFDSIT